MALAGTSKGATACLISTTPDFKARQQLAVNLIQHPFILEAFRGMSRDEIWAEMDLLRRKEQEEEEADEKRSSLGLLDSDKN